MPAISQKAMDAIIQGLPQAIYHLDDILVTGATNEKQLHNLEEILNQLQQHNIWPKCEKCQFMKESVDYCIAGIFCWWKLSRNAESQIFAIKTLVTCRRRQFVGVAGDHTYYNAWEGNDEQDWITWTGVNKMIELNSSEVVTIDEGSDVYVPV